MVGGRGMFKIIIRYKSCSFSSFGTFDFNMTYGKFKYLSILGHNVSPQKMYIF